MIDTYSIKTEQGYTEYRCELCEQWVNTDKGKDFHEWTQLDIGGHEITDCIKGLAERVYELERLNRVEVKS